MLAQVLRPVKEIFDPASYPDLLVGLDGPDDAAVWRLSEDRGIVVTTDFFTPVVDDAYDYGSIAAANSLSDVYAMGGTPFLALNIAALPDDLPPEISREIMRGGAEKAREAGVVIAGGQDSVKGVIFRIAHMGFTSLREVDATYGAVGALLQRHGIAGDVGAAAEAVAPYYTKIAALHKA